MNAVVDPQSAVVAEAPHFLGRPLGGHDLVVEISEATLNRLLGAYHYMGRFPVLKGKYMLPIRDSPEDLLEFITILYDVNFGIPKIDFQRDCVRVIFQPSTQLTVLGGLTFAIDIDLSLDIFPVFDPTQQKVLLNFQNPAMDLKINNAPVSSKVADKLNEILRIMVCQHFVEKVRPIDVSPFIRYTYRLPDMKPKVALNVKGFFLGNHSIGIATNFLDYDEGNISEVRDFTKGRDAALGLSTSGLQRIFGFWWRNSRFQNEIKDSGAIVHLNLHPYQLSADLLHRTLGIHLPNLGSILDGIMSGLVVDLKRLDAQYKYSMKIEEPIVTLKSGDNIALTVNAKVQFHIELVLIYKVLKIVHWKPKKVEKSKRLGTWTDAADVCVKGSAQFDVDEANRLMANIGNCSMRIDVDNCPPFLDAIVSNLAQKFLNKIVGRLSPVQLFVVPVDCKIPGSSVSIPLTLSLSSTKKEVFFHLTAGRVEGLEAYSPPPYIANKSKDHMEVHKAECRHVPRIAARNQVGYYWLDYAYEDKFDNCAFCLGDSKK